MTAIVLRVVAIGAEALPDAPEAPEHPPYAVCPPPLPRRSSSPGLVAAATRGETLEHRTVFLQGAQNCSWKQLVNERFFESLATISAT